MTGKRALLLVLMAAASFGCSQDRAEYGYQVTMPILHTAPMTHPCMINDQPGSCRCYAEDDAKAIVRKLKAACLALGGTVQDCQTEEPEGMGL